MVKIKLFDTNITFKDYPRLSLSLWNNTDFYVIVQDVDQPAFAQILSPSPLSPLPSPLTHDYFTFCSCADGKNKAINNILSLPKTEL